MPKEVPFELTSIDAEAVAKLLGYSKAHVVNKLAYRSDFPARCDPKGGKPRWIAGEVMEWREKCRNERF